MIGKGYIILSTLILKTTINLKLFYIIMDFRILTQI